MNLHDSQKQILFNPLNSVSLDLGEFAVIVLNLAFYTLANKM